MGKVNFITTLALIQAFVLFSGQANAQTTTSTAGTVSESTAATVPESTTATVSQSTAATVSSTAGTVSESTAATVSESTTAIVSQSTTATVSESGSQSTAATGSQSTTATVSQSTTATASQSTAATGSQSTAATVSQSTAATASQSTTATASQSTAATLTVSQSKAATVSQSTAATASQSTAATASQSTATPASQSTAAASSQSTPAVVSQSTPASPPSSSVAPPTPGSVVIICLLVKVPYCNATLHGSTSSSQSQALLANITTNMKSTYSAAQVTVISVYLTSSSCGSNNYVALYIKVTLKLGIPTNRYIETILKDEIKDKYLGNLPVSDTQYNVTFEGVTLGYNIKDGECQRVCCGAGGPVVMVEKCTPKDNKYKCEGFLAKERDEKEHCHGEANDLCSSTKCTDKACSSHSPSLALLLLLTIASLLKLTAF